MKATPGSGTMREKRAGGEAYPTTRRKGGRMKRLTVLVALLCLLGCHSADHGDDHAGAAAVWEAV